MGTGVQFATYMPHKQYRTHQTYIYIRHRSSYGTATVHGPFIHSLRDSFIQSQSISSCIICSIRMYAFLHHTQSIYIIACAI